MYCSGLSELILFVESYPLINVCGETGKLGPLASLLLNECIFVYQGTHAIKQGSLLEYSFQGS